MDFVTKIMFKYSMDQARELAPLVGFVLFILDSILLVNIFRRDI